MDYLAPGEVIEGIAGMEGKGKTREQILSTIALNFETQAKYVLTKKGYAPDFETYCYKPLEGLTEQEIKEDERQWKHYQWINEATQLTGHSDFLINQAANTILEAGSLRNFIELGETNKAVVSMAILLSCGFLHSDQNKEKSINALNLRNEALKPDAILGEKIRKNNKKFADKNGRFQTEERRPIWDSWQVCAEKIAKENKGKAFINNKSEMARRVKKHLDLTEEIQTIRKKLKINW